MIAKYYSSAQEAAEGLTEELLTRMNATSHEKFSLAISGGNNPAILFKLWATTYKDRIPWNVIQLYWVDERCVPPTDDESNYLMAKRHLLDLVPLKDDQIYRIHGEDDPIKESARYSELLKSNLSVREGLPIFDCVLLGVGPDGHTASVFPNQEHLYEICVPYFANVNPNTLQERVTMMPCTILNAECVYFFATGQEKASILEDVTAGNEHLPAGYVAKHAKNAALFMA